MMGILRGRRFHTLVLVLLVWSLDRFSLDAPSTLVACPTLPALFLLPTTMVVHLLHVVMLTLHGLKALLWLLRRHLLVARLFRVGVLLYLLWWMVLCPSSMAAGVLIEGVLIFFLFLILLPHRILMLNFLLHELWFLRQAILCRALVACIVVVASFLGSEERARVKRTVERPSSILVPKCTDNGSMEIRLAACIQWTMRIIDWAMLTFLFETMNSIIVADCGIEWRERPVASPWLR